MKPLPVEDPGTPDHRTPARYLLWTARTQASINTAGAAIAGFVVVQGVLIRYAYLASARLGERVLAELREDFVTRVLALPLSTVERAGTGDLVSRTSRDVSTLATSVRYAMPELLIGIVVTVLTVGALILTGPLVALPCLVAVPVLWGAMRWYLPRARDGYLRENVRWAELTDGLAETVHGARTVEALRLAERRHRRADAAPTPTGSRWSRTAASPNWARTTS